MGTRAIYEFDGELHYWQFDGYPDGALLAILIGEFHQDHMEKIDTIPGDIQYRYEITGDRIIAYGLDDDWEWEEIFNGTKEEFIKKYRKEGIWK